MYLLDTDTLLHVQAGHSGIAAKIRTAGDDDIGTTIISVIELLRPRYEFILKASDGAELMRAQQWLETNESLLSQLDVIRIDAAAAKVFDSLQMARGLRRIGRADLLIASITLANGATLVSRNLRDFRRVPGLKVVNWVD